MIYTCDSNLSHQPSESFLLHVSEYWELLRRETTLDVYLDQVWNEGWSSCNGDTQAMEHVHQRRDDSVDCEPQSVRSTQRHGLAGRGRSIARQRAVEIGRM